MIEKGELKSWLMLYLLHKELFIDIRESRNLNSDKLTLAYMNASEKKKEPLKKIISEINTCLDKRKEINSYIFQIEKTLENQKKRNKENDLKKENLKEEGRDNEELIIDSLIKKKEEEHSNSHIQAFLINKSNFQEDIKEIDRAIKKQLIEAIEPIKYFSREILDDDDLLFEDYSSELSDKQLENILDIGYSFDLIDYLLDEKNIIKSKWNGLNHLDRLEAIASFEINDYRRAYFSLLLLKNLEENSLTQDEKEENFYIIKIIFNLINRSHTYYDNKTHTLSNYSFNNYLSLIEFHKEIKEIIPTQGEIKALELFINSLNKKEKKKLTVFGLLTSLKIDDSELTTSYNSQKVQAFYYEFKKIIPSIDEILYDQLSLNKVENKAKIKEKEKVIIKALLEGNIPLDKEELNVSITKKEGGEMHYELMGLPARKELTKKEIEKKLIDHLHKISKETHLDFNLIELRLAIFHFIKNNHKQIDEDMLEAMKFFIVESKKIIKNPPITIKNIISSKEVIDKKWIEKDWLEGSINKKMNIRHSYKEDKLDKKISKFEQKCNKNLIPEEIKENRELEAKWEKTIIKKPDNWITRTYMNLDRRFYNTFRIPRRINSSSNTCNISSDLEMIGGCNNPFKSDNQDPPYKKQSKKDEKIEEINTLPLPNEAITKIKEVSPNKKLVKL